MKRIFVALLLVIAACGCVGQEAGDQVVITNSLEKGVVVDVEIVKDQEEIMRGLMYRESLDEDAGMLFIFEGDNYRSFWMKNTLIPLDMLFINSTLTIIDIKRDVQPCKASPCPLYPSTDVAMYVLEVNAGFTERHEIEIGDKIGINP